MRGSSLETARNLAVDDVHSHPSNLREHLYERMLWEGFRDLSLYLTLKTDSQTHHLIAISRRQMINSSFAPRGVAWRGAS